MIIGHAILFLHSIQPIEETKYLKDNVRICFSKHEMTKWISRLTLRFCDFIAKKCSHYALLKEGREFLLFFTVLTARKEQPASVDVNPLFE